MLKIIVPIYNTEKYLERCIESIKKQKYRDFQCLLIDDGSTDNSLKICTKFAEDDLRFIVISKQNGGVVSAIKAGLNCVNVDDVVGFIDSDDVVAEGLFENMMNGFIKYDCDLAVTDISYCDEDLKITQRIQVGYDEGFYPNIKADITDGLLLEEVFGSRWNKFFKADLLINVAEFMDETLSIGEDEMWTYSALLNAQTMYVVHGDNYLYVQHNSSMMATAACKKRIYDCGKVLIAIAKVLEKNGYDHNKTRSFLSLSKRYVSTAFWKVVLQLERNNKKESIVLLKKIKNFLAFENVQKSLEKAGMKDKIILFLFVNGFLRTLCNVILLHRKLKKMFCIRK